MAIQAKYMGKGSLGSLNIPYSQENAGIILSKGINGVLRGEKSYFMSLTIPRKRILRR
jgi:hypothetical protein